MFLSNRPTERNAMKNKEKLKQRVISPKLPPSQPVEHLCVLFSAKNDAVGCQRLPIGFPRVSPLLHPSFGTVGERKDRKKKRKQKPQFQMPAHNPGLIFLVGTYGFFFCHTQHVYVSHCLYVTATVISIANCDHKEFLHHAIKPDIRDP